MRRLRLGLTASCAAWCLCACGLLPQPPAPLALHDFGPQAATVAAAPPTRRVEVEAVHSPSWLANAQIHYRWLHDEPTRLRAYAQNEWVAPPAQLLTARLRLAFDSPDFASASPGGRPAYRLDVDLLDFEQVFDTTRSARVTLSAVVSLRDGPGGRVFGPRRFDLSTASPPNVRGAVTASAAAVDELVAAIVRWTHDAPPLPDGP
jgi:cholesterol transport system auxiliary component